jgi:hypothetical protein
VENYKKNVACVNLKDQRWWPDEGGFEWESIKIPCGNLAYVPKATRCTSCLTQTRTHSYWKAIGPRNLVRQRKSQQKHKSVQVKPQARLQHSKSDQLTNHCHIYISPNTLWTCQRNHEWSMVRTRKTRAFDLVAREQDRLPHATIHTQSRSWFGDKIEN